MTCTDTCSTNDVFAYAFLAFLMGSLIFSLGYSLYRKFYPKRDENGNVIEGCKPYKFDSIFKFD